MADLPPLNLLRCIACLHMSSDIYQTNAHAVPGSLIEIDCPWRIIIVAVAVIISGRVSCDAQRQFLEGRAPHWTIEIIGFVINAPTAIRINAHEAVRW
jgi:hypothetical protein